MPSKVKKNKMMVAKISNQSKITTHSVIHQAYTPVEHMHQGEAYVIVPVVMMVEGVHSGSRGPLFHSAEVISRDVHLWNDIPVMVHHPQDEEGRFISAAQASQKDKAVGMLRNPRWEDGKLKANAWLNVQKLIAASPEAIAHIRSGRPLEVSIGVFSQEIEATGEWNGEVYSGITLSYHPDHLALLPGEQGACSWADGCGVRVNQCLTNNEETMGEKEKKVAEENPTAASEKISTNVEGGGLLDQMLDLNRTHFYRVELIANETGYAEVMDKLRQKVDGMDNDQRVYFLVEVFEDSFIYRSTPREARGQPERMYKQEYSIGENQQIEFVGEPVEVRREVEYVTMEATTMRRTKGKPAEISINQEKEGGNTMSDVSEKSPCLTAKVEALIANEATRFTGDDKEWLLAQSEDTLNKLEPKEPDTKEESQEEPQINRDQALEVLNLHTLEDFTALMPEAMRKQVESGLKLREDTRADAIKEILANTGDVWNEDELKEFSCEKLAKIRKSTKPVVDYSGAVAGDGDVSANSEQAGEEPLLPAGVEKKTK